jgi:hypothetical protein
MPFGSDGAFLSAKEAAEKLYQGRERLTADAKAQEIFNDLRHD